MIRRMNEWYYSEQGQQKGPVSFDELRQRALSGLLDPARDLVWNSSMDAWRPAGQVAGLFATGPDAALNPYAPPLSPDLAPAPTGGILPMIEPGSQPLDPIASIVRAFHLTNRNFLLLLGIGALYYLISWVSGMLLGFIGAGFTLPYQTSVITPVHGGDFMSAFQSAMPPITPLYVICTLANMVVSLFLYLGLTRVALNYVSGNDVSVSQLFGEGRKLLRAAGAGILVGLAVLLGLVLLIVPGIWLGLRLGQIVPAILDRNLGVMDSIKYSWDLTRNSALSLFALSILGGLISLAGILACGVGIIYAMPIVILSMAVAFRLLQYGRVALEDIPGTKTPALRGRTQQG